jgi:type I restriction enzyme, S subunit
VIQSNNKCKKIKKVKPISEEEVSKLSELPENWKRVRLNDLSFLITDGKHGDCRNHENSGYFFISAKDIFDGKINYANARQIKKEDFEEVHKRTDLQPGDILVTNAGTIGRIAIATANDKTSKTTFQKSVAIIKKPNSLIDSKYLAYHLENDVERIKLVSKGTAQKNLLLGTMSELIIVICPFPEQRAIVSKIEQLFSELDNGIANLKLAQEQLKVYRQAVLKKAFEGELTRKWREQQLDLPDANDFLKRIQKEREEVTKSGKKLQKNNQLNETELSELPNGWGWTRLGNLVEEPKYGTSKKCDYNINGIGVLRIPNISDGLINDSDLKFAQFNSTEIENYRLKTGDILTIRSNGSVDLVGKCALVSSKDEKYLYAGYLIRLRPRSPLINSKYLLNCLSSIDLRYQIESKAKSTSGVNNINSGELQSLIIPLCSLPEQQAIVQEIETRLSVCDKIEQENEANLERAEALRQSILKKAFEGKLLNEKELAEVRRAEDWEVAEVLLQKIKAERAGNVKKALIL